MRKVPSTLGQIARDLALNRATVSLVINGHAKTRGLSARTVERVHAYMRETGFVPSRDAVQLRTGQRSRTGILHCGGLYTHLTMAFNALTESLASADEGAEVVIKPRRAILDGLRDMASRGVGRLVWIQAGRNEFPDGAERYQALQLAARLRPTVYNFCFGIDDNQQELLDYGFNLVGVSRRHGYRQMASFLHGLGHRHVLLCDASTESITDTLDRDLGLAMKTCGVHATYFPGPIPSNHNYIERGRRTVAALVPVLAARPEITALCFRDDEVAAGALAELNARGFRIPHDLTVISMDGHPMGGVFPVPLTTFAVPVDSLVKATLKLATSDKSATTVRRRYRLIERASHGPARRHG